jgi:hypothetical protein
MLRSVACLSARHCVAVGDFTTGKFRDLGEGMEAVLSNGRWQPATAMPQPTSQARLSELDSVSCQPSGFCVAVGNSDGGALYTVLSNGRWQPSKYMTTVPADGSSGQFTAVSCTAHACLAAGIYYPNNASRVAPPFAVTFSGGRWRDPVRLPLPRNSVHPKVGSVISTGAVSCFSSTSCTVVGLYDTSKLVAGWADTGPAGGR